MNIKNAIRKIAKKSKLARKIYFRYKSTRINYNLEISENPICGRKSAYLSDRIRINLLLPSINNSHLFGGISTALKFFLELIEQNDYEGRIIVTDAAIDLKRSVKLDGFKCLKPNDENDAKLQIVDFSGRNKKTIPVRKNDVFLATIWWSMYNIQSLLAWQKNTYRLNGLKVLYFIQDYEPGFYQWSSYFALADFTYKIPYKTIAIINSDELSIFFKQNKYGFYRNYSFNPTMNIKLKEMLNNLPDVVAKKKQILIYGRPSAPRNAFEIIVSALKIWSRVYDKSDEWEILSAGETHRKILLSNNKKITNLGKLSLENYAKVLADSYAGISLMISPHPSYPPLEMSTFGVKTITNNYFNKNLSSFSKNILAIDNCNPETIANCLIALCESYQEKVHIQKTSCYLNNHRQFDEIISKIKIDLAK